MMKSKYVIVNRLGLFVADGMKVECAYTKNPETAQKFPSPKEARRFAFDTESVINCSDARKLWKERRKKN